MESKDELTGRLVRLPDGQPVRIETVYDDGYAAVRRLRGALRGTKAVCAISQLEPFDSGRDTNKNP